MTESNPPNLCYIAVPGAAPGRRIGIVKRGEKGYYLADYDQKTSSYGYLSDAKIKEFVAEMNEKLGVSAAEADAMLMGSMFGWDCPGAQVRRAVAR
jgi:hypothetical protein